MITRVFSVVLAILMLCLCCIAAGGEVTLDEWELTELIMFLRQQGGDAADFVVLPDGYPVPGAGTFLVEPEDSQLAEVSGSMSFKLLIIGVDTDNQSLSGRSDTMILAQLDPAGGSVKLVSFMRDLYVSIPDRGSNRLNAAYAFGGPDLLILTLEENFGVRADGYLSVNFNLMEELVNAIGGIQITVSDKELQSLNAIMAYYNQQQGRPKSDEKLTESGYVTLTGRQALAFARIRKMDSDYQRVIRQQEILKAILQRMLTLDFVGLSTVLTRFIPQVKTNLTIAEAIALLQNLLALNDTHLSTLRVPVSGSAQSRTIRGMYLIVADLMENQQAIDAFLAP
ncbi:MAG: LCP family protein [Eubacteriales bacterium]|nr:LCP family protein [Eubacteriales bacterium]